MPDAKGQRCWHGTRQCFAFHRRPSASCLGRHTTKTAARRPSPERPPDTSHTSLQAAAARPLSSYCHDCSIDYPAFLLPSLAAKAASCARRPDPYSVSYPPKKHLSYNSNLSFPDSSLGKRCINTVSTNIPTCSFSFFSILVNNGFISNPPFLASTLFFVLKICRETSLFVTFAAC